MSDAVTKPALRRQLRTAREAFARSGRLIPTPASFLQLLAPGMVVASYVPFGAEADPAPLMHAARQAGCRIALPYVVDRETPLRFLAWHEDEPLLPGPFGLRQPAQTAPELTPEIILTPLVGFDAAGNRIGQGAGYYDRAFARYPDAWRIGVAWSVQQVETIAADAWDVPLHAIITEREWITP